MRQRKDDISILIAEDRAVLRLGLQEILKRVEGCRVIAEAKDGPDAIEQTVKLKPRIAIIKRDLPVMDGVDVSLELKKQQPETSVILLLSSESDFWRSLDSQADGYILREAPDRLISAAIHTVSEGDCWIGPIIVKYLLKGEGLPLLRSGLVKRDDAPALEALSTREREVVRHLVSGSSNKQIADELGLKSQTVKVHIRNIFRKLAVKGRGELISRVLRTGMAV